MEHYSFHHRNQNPQKLELYHSFSVVRFPSLDQSANQPYNLLDHGEIYNYRRNRSILLICNLCIHLHISFPLKKGVQTWCVIGIRSHPDIRSSLLWTHRIILCRHLFTFWN
jgi:hypothetical protein